MLRGHTFFDIKHLQIAWVANAASSHGGRVRKRQRISASVEIFQVSAKKNLFHTCNAIIFTCVEPSPRWTVLQHHASGYCTSRTQAKCFTASIDLFDCTDFHSLGLYTTEARLPILHSFILLRNCKKFASTWNLLNGRTSWLIIKCTQPVT